MWEQRLIIPWLNDRRSSGRDQLDRDVLGNIQHTGKITKLLLPVKLPVLVLQFVEFSPVLRLSPLSITA